MRWLRNLGLSRKIVLATSSQVAAGDFKLGSQTEVLGERLTKLLLLLLSRTAVLGSSDQACGADLERSSKRQNECDRTELYTRMKRAADGNTYLPGVGDV